MHITKKFLILFLILCLSGVNSVFAYKPQAEQIETNKSNFNGLLSTESNVQEVADTLDDITLDDLPLGAVYKRIYIPINGGTCSKSDGCIDSDLNETSTYETNYWSAAFADDADDNWDFERILPENYIDGGNFYFAVKWIADSDTTGGGVSFFLKLKVTNHGDSLDGVYGTPVESNGDWSASGSELRTALSSAVTAANSPVGGDTLRGKLYRDVDDSDDDLTGGSNNYSNVEGIYLIFPIDKVSTED